jgi:hypothetical protein
MVPWRTLGNTEFNFRAASLCFTGAATVNENIAVKMYPSVSETVVSGPLVVRGGAPHSPQYYTRIVNIIFYNIP